MSLIPAEMKELTSLGGKVISAANPSSITLTLSNSYRGILIGFSASGVRCFMALVQTTSIGTVSITNLAIPIGTTSVLGSSISYDTSTANKLTITKDGSNAVYVYDITFEGTVS